MLSDVMQIQNVGIYIFIDIPSDVSPPPHPSKVVVANVENNHHKLKEHEILKMALNINIEGPQIGSPGSGNEQTRRSICTVTCSNMSFPDSMKNFDRWTKRFFRCIVNHSLLAVYDGHPKTYLK